MTTEITVPYSNLNEFAQLAAQLRALGAKFYVENQEHFRIIKFCKLTSQAFDFIQSYQNNKPPVVEEISIEVGNIKPSFKKASSYLTYTELNRNYNKQELIELANFNGLAIPTSCQRKSRIVKFLADKIKK